MVANIDFGGLVKRHARHIRGEIPGPLSIPATDWVNATLNQLAIFPSGLSGLGEGDIVSAAKTHVASLLPLQDVAKDP